MITVTLPWPARKLSPNARVHWAELRREKDWARYTAKALMVEAMGVTAPQLADGDIAIEMQFCPPTRRKFDRDNLLASMKAQLDGIAEALGIDDTRFDPVTSRRGPVIAGGQVIVKIG